MIPSKDERFVLDTLLRLVVPAFPGQQRIAAEAAIRRCKAGKVLSPDERTSIGSMLYVYAGWLETRDLLDPDAERLYRKCMGHDRRTMKPPPYPSLRQ